MKVIIDNKELKVPDNKTILEVARENDIYIPSLCDHPSLKPFAGCRLCIVEITGRKGFSPSCSTYVEDGMEVKTKTRKLQKFRKQILELILSEHPNACLICSEKEQCDEYKATIRKVGEVTGCVLCSNNGRCELQDVVEAVKLDKLSFPSLYRDFEVRKNDPFFDRNYNLCLLCGRCVRICHEVRGASAISFVFRGSLAVVGTALNRTLLESGCQFCGACVDVCPTGALAERAIKPESLPDETAKTVCPLCSLGCELKIELKQGMILSSVPDESGPVNQGQACVKGRFAIRELVYTPKRILNPLIRMKRELEEVSWEEALSFVAQKLKKYKGKDIAFISSPQTTNEENFLYQKFAQEVLETGNIDSSAGFFPLASYWDWAREAGLSPALNFKVENISKARTIFLIGADITVSHPIVGLEIIKAVNDGVQLVIVDPKEIPLNRFSSFWLKIKPGTDLYFLLFLSKVLFKEGKTEHFFRAEGFTSFKKILDKVDISKLTEITGVSEEDVREIAKILSEERPVVFLFGLGLTQHPWGKENIAALWNLALMSEAQLFPLGLENNLRGELEMRRHFAPQGLRINQIIQAAGRGSLNALYLVGAFPSLEKTKPEFLVCQDSFSSENMKWADAVLPSTTFAETEGTFTNLEGRIQRFKRVIGPQGEAKPDWWIISQLAQKMGNKDFDYKSASKIMEKIKEEIPIFSEVSYSQLGRGKETFINEEVKEKRKFVPTQYHLTLPQTSNEFPFLMLSRYNLDYYKSLNLSQEIKGLRIMRDSRWIKINPEDAKELKIEEGKEIELEYASSRITGIAKFKDGLPRGIIGTNFLWNDSSCFSLARLSSEFNPDSFSLKMIPVKIVRSKK